MTDGPIVHRVTEAGAPCMASAAAAADDDDDEQVLKAFFTFTICMQ